MQATLIVFSSFLSLSQVDLVSIAHVAHAHASPGPNGTAHPGTIKRQHGWDPRRNVLVHPHMHKTAGTSLIDDLVHQANLKSCLGKTSGLHLCIDGWLMSGFMKKAADAHVMLAMHRVKAHDVADCNFLSCEVNLDRALALSGLRRDRRARVVLQLRSPLTMAVSMWLMCQERTAEGETVFSLAANNEQISLDGWLQAVAANDGSALRYCRFDPRNEMVHRLSTFKLRSAPVAQLDVAKRWVERAFHVGVQEEYDASLCLLLTRLHRAGPSCSCAHGRQPVSGEGTYAYMGLTRGPPLQKNHSSKVVVSQAGQALIRRLAALDFELYAVARQRFLRDITALNMTCLLRSP